VCVCVWEFSVCLGLFVGVFVCVVVVCIFVLGLCTVNNVFKYITQK